MYDFGNLFLCSMKKDHAFHTKDDNKALSLLFEQYLDIQDSLDEEKIIENDFENLPWVLNYHFSCDYQLPKKMFKEKI